MSFIDFAKICERVRKTSSKSVKVAIIADYLKKLSDTELPITVRFLSGRIFPKGSSLDMNIGYRTLLKALVNVTGLSRRKLLELYKKYGDLGSMTEEALREKRALKAFFGEQEEVSLREVYDELKRIAEISGEESVKRREIRLRGLLSRLSPLEVKYLFKLILSELRIGVVEGIVEQSIAEAFNRNLDEVRRAVLLTGDIGEVALMAKRNKLDQARITPLRPLGFMLAEPFSSPKEIEEYFGRELVAEYKYDGIRTQLHKKNNEIRLFSRRLEDITESFPEIINGAKKLAHDIILDGEVLAFKNGHPLPFSELQKRLRRKDPWKIMEEIPVIYLVYDIVYLDGQSLIEKPLLERKEVLKNISFPEPLKLSPYRIVRKAEEIEKMFRESRRQGHEGLMLKVPDSQYEVGKRGKKWVKLKEGLDTIDAVVVAAEYGHGKRAGLLSDLVFAVWDKDQLKIIGKAYSGLTDAEIRRMTNELKKLAIKEEGIRIWVKPKIVVEVAFDSVQKSERHESGYALRFPRIKRLRLDKRPEDADTIEKLRMLAEKSELSS